LDCGGTTPLLLHAWRTPAALEFSAACAPCTVQEKRGHVPAVQSQIKADRTNFLTTGPSWCYKDIEYQQQNMEPNMNTSGTASKNVLNSDVEIKGNIKFSGELTLDGKLDGEIHTDGTLNLGDSAVVNGNINAANVVVRGKINGNITAKEKIDIKSKTELFGDIRATKLAIEEGVTFVGKTEVNPNKVSPTPPLSRTNEAPRIPEPAKSGGR